VIDYYQEKMLTWLSLTLICSK